MTDIYLNRSIGANNAHLTFVRECELAMLGIKVPIKDVSDFSNVKIFEKTIMKSLLDAARNLSSQNLYMRLILFQDNSEPSDNPLQYVQTRVNILWLYCEACIRLEEAISCEIDCNEITLLIGQSFNEIFRILPGLELTDLGRATTNLHKCHCIRNLLKNKSGDELICASLRMCQKLTEGSALRWAKEIANNDILKVLLEYAYSDPIKEVHIAAHKFLITTIFCEEALKSFLEELIHRNDKIIFNTLLGLSSEIRDVDLKASLYATRVFLTQIKKWENVLREYQSLDLVIESILKLLLDSKISKINSAIVLESMILITDGLASNQVLSMNYDKLSRFIQVVVSNDEVDTAKLERFVTQCISAFDTESNKFLAKEMFLATLKNPKILASVSVKLFTRLLGLRGIIKLLFEFYSLSKLPNDEYLPSKVLEAIFTELDSTQPMCVSNTLADCIAALPNLRLISLSLIEIILSSRKCGIMVAEVLRVLIDLIFNQNQVSNINDITLETALCAILNIVNYYPSQNQTDLQSILPLLAHYLQASPRCIYLASNLIISISELYPLHPSSSELIGKLLSFCDTDPTTVWNGQPNSLTQKTIPAAVWSIILNHLPGIETHCDSYIVNDLAHLLISHLPANKDFLENSIAAMTSLVLRQLSFFELNRISIAYTNILLEKILSEYKHQTTIPSEASALSTLFRHLVLVPTLRLKSCINTNIFSELQSLSETLAMWSHSSNENNTIVDVCVCLCNCLSALAISNFTSNQQSLSTAKNYTVTSDSSNTWIVSVTNIIKLVASQPYYTQLDTATNALLAEVSRFYSHAPSSSSTAQFAACVICDISTLRNEYMCELRLHMCKYTSNLQPQYINENVIKSVELLLMHLIDEIIEDLRKGNQSKQYDPIILKLAKTVITCLKVLRNRRPLQPNVIKKIQDISEYLSLILNAQDISIPFCTALLLVEFITEIHTNLISNLGLLFYHFPQPNNLLRAADDFEHNEIILESNNCIARIISRSPFNILSNYLNELDLLFRSQVSNLIRSPTLKASRNKLLIEKRIYGLIVLVHSSMNTLPICLLNQCTIISSILRSSYSISTLVTPCTLIRLFDLERRVMLLKGFRLQPSDSYVILSTSASVLIKSTSFKASHHHRNIDAFNSLCSCLSSLLSRRFHLTKKFFPLLVVILKLLIESFLSPNFKQSLISNLKFKTDMKSILPQESARGVLFLTNLLNTKFSHKKSQTKGSGLIGVFTTHLTILLSHIFVMQNQSRSFRSLVSPVINEIIVSLLKVCPKANLKSAISTIPTSSPERETLKILMKELEQKFNYKGQF